MNPLSPDLDHILGHTQGLWEEMRGERVFITGGTGFFGCWLLESFVWANEKLSLNASATVLTRNPQSFQEKAPHLARNQAVNLQVGDVRDFTFPPGEFAYVIHAAADSDARLYQTRPSAMFDTLVRGTRHTLEFAQQANTRKFLLTSSGAVYGKQPPAITHVPEEYMGGPDPLDCRSAYGEGKRAAETLCAMFARPGQFEPKVARCFAFVGPHLPLDLHFAIGNFISDALRGGPIEEKGDGTAFRSYLHAADLAIWLWTILFKGLPCRAYNVGSDSDLTIGQLANLVAELAAPTANVLIRRNAIPFKPAERYVPSIARARTELHLAPFIDLPEAIRRSIAWLRSRQSKTLRIRTTALLTKTDASHPCEEMKL